MSCFIMRRRVRLLSSALILLSFIGTSTNAEPHTGPHWSSSATTVSAVSVVTTEGTAGAKSLKKKHTGNGGKHDVGVDGKHPTETSTSKAGKPNNSWELPPFSYTTINEDKGTKAAKASSSITKSESSTPDSKADKGEEKSKAEKQAPNEYNGFFMVVKSPGAKSGVWSSVTATNDTEPVFSTEATSEGISTAATLPATETASIATTTVPVKKAPPVPYKYKDNSSPDYDNYRTEMPTYAPTTAEVLEQDESVEETFTALDPFGLRFLSSKPQPNFDMDIVTTITIEHLLHSFRTKGWDAERLKLMLLDDEEDGRRRLRLLDSFPVKEVVFGGILYFKVTNEMPSAKETSAIVEDSFSGGRLSYYVNLLKEKGLDVTSASWGHLETSSEPSTGGGSKGKLGLILGAVLGSICLIIVLILLTVRLYNKHQMRIKDASKSSLVFRIKDEVEMMDFNDRPEAATIPSTIVDDAAASRYSHHTKRSLISDGPISALEPSDELSTCTRYVSVFTVKKDCGGRPIEQVDLRSLAIAYLSRLFKKVPDTKLLPYDKQSDLPAITNIRNIPDDLQELLEYVGHPRIDEDTGKVLFNLRCESDVPMSKMKNSSGRKTTTSENYSSSSGFEDVSL